MPKERTSYDDRPERVGRKGITTYLPEAVAKRLKMIAVANDLTIQQITEAAVMEWMTRHEKKTAAVAVAQGRPVSLEHLNAVTAELSAVYDQRESAGNRDSLPDQYSAVKALASETARQAGKKQPAKGKASEPAFDGGSAPLDRIGKPVRQNRASKN